MNQRISTLALVSIAVLGLPTSSGHAAESASTWIYPQSQLGAQGGPNKNTSSFTQSESIDVRSTDDSIAEVVQYYVRQSGFEPPSWAILGREFPYPKHLPVGIWQGPGKTTAGAARVSITHDLRPNVAQVTFLVVAEAGAITSISITRGKKEDKTWIQVHEHALKTMTSSQAAQRTKP